MFNDERINKEMSKLKKLIIIISFIVSVIFLLYKLIAITFYKESYLNLALEGFIFVVSLTILLIPLFTKEKNKDELYIKKKEKYYDKAFIIFLYLVLGAYSFLLPLYAINKGTEYSKTNLSMSLIINFSVYVAYGFLRFKKIYFNYNIIEENKNKYYKIVSKNILKIAKFVSFNYVLTFPFSIIYLIENKSFLLIIIMLITFIIIFALSTAYYLLMSILERVSFDEENKKRMTTSTFILLTLAFLGLISANIFNLIFAFVIEKNFYYDANTLMIIQYIVKSFRISGKFCIVLGLIFLVSDISKNNMKLLNKFKGFIIAFIIYVIIETIYSDIGGTVINIIIQTLIDNKVFSLDHSSYVSIFKNVININLLISRLFYIIMAIILLVEFKDNLKGIIMPKVILISYISYYIIYGIAYEINTTITMYFLILLMIMLVLTYVYLLVIFLSKNNKYCDEDLRG